MQEDTIIQKNLFAISNDDNNEQKEITKIPEDLSLEDLKKESQKRPRQRNNSTNLINKFLTLLLPTMISEESNLIISSNSFDRDWPSKVINSPVLTSAFDIPHS